MKTNYRVRRKSGGPQGIVEKEFGTPEQLKVMVYWGTTSDGVKGQPVRHYTTENFEDLIKMEGQN